MIALPERKYICAVYDIDTQMSLYDWCMTHGFHTDAGGSSELLDREFHSTIWYTDEAIMLDNDVIDISIECYPEGFEILGKNEDALVITVRCPELNEYRDMLGRMFDISDSWPYYRPHITLCYGWDSSGLPNVPMPDFPLIADSLEIRPQ